jgi:2-polyprenyl-6-methoxyphenol hydroxylase-like FAD-dependent oxidoreductase
MMNCDKPSGKPDTDVLIVGAGPVGLAVAVELGLRGIRCQVVEQQPAIGHWWTRAMNMNTRTMEHMRRWGIAQKLKEVNFVPARWPGNVSFVDGLGGRQLAYARADGLGWHRTLGHAAEDALWIAQGQVQQVLLDKALNLGAAVTFSTKAIALHQAQSGPVVVSLEGSEGRHYEIAARYVVGCDGGRSVIRNEAGIVYEGAGKLSRQIGIFFRAPALLESLRKRGVVDSVMYMSARPDMPGIARLIAGDRWEFSYRLPPGFDEENFDASALVRRLVGPDISFELERTYPFSYFELIAQAFRRGRVLVAGDAAHLIPPLGGHNLNLGFGDAVNLGWKLAHVLQGWADDGILDSYGPERLPVIKQTAATAYENYERLRKTFERLFDAMNTGGDAEDDWRRREEVSQQIARDLEPQWQSDGTVLDIRYAHSPIVAAEDGEAPPFDPSSWQPCAAPGHRAPMVRIGDGVPLYDLFGPEYTLLDMSSAPQSGAQAFRALTDAGLHVQHLRIPQPELRSVYGASLVVIRPDQHVAWRGEALAEDARSLVGKFTARAAVFVEAS